MVATNIVYFSLIAASWMSAVSAMIARDAFPIGTVRRFLRRTNTEDNWTEAYNEVNRESLDRYFKKRVEKLKSYIDPYIGSLHPEEIEGSLVPRDPDPDLQNQLREVRKLVFLIRDSNLRILNDIKRHLGHRELQPILVAINNDMVQSVAARYAEIMREQARREAEGASEEGAGIWIELPMIDMALLFSLNKAMLSWRELLYPAEVEKLLGYQTVINLFHDHMSRYMQIQTRVPYFGLINHLSFRLGELYDNEIYGYSRIREQLQTLSNLILSVVVIYGSANENGKEMLSTLLGSNRAIRRYMKVDPPPFEQFNIWSDNLLRSLYDAVGITVNHTWHGQLQYLVNRLVVLGRRG